MTKLMEDILHEPQQLIGSLDYTAGHGKPVDDMRARLYELMARQEDLYSDVSPRNGIGERPNFYGAARYLPRGRRA